MPMVSIASSHNSSGAVKDSCPDCGWEISFPSVGVRLLYRQCPYCKYQLKPATALSIPEPHCEIQNCGKYELCLARICDRGRERKCPRFRRLGSDYCPQHRKVFERYGRLPYGRSDEPYDGANKLLLDQTLTLDQVLEREQREAKEHDVLSYEERLKRLKSIKLAVPDTEILSKTRQLVKLEQVRGKEKALTTERMLRSIEPTFGLDIKTNCSKLKWLKDSTQALMTLPARKFVVLAAAIGEVFDPSSATDVGSATKSVVFHQGSSGLKIPRQKSLCSVLGLEHGSLERFKQPIFRLRYAMNGRLAEVSREVDKKSGCLVKGLNVDADVTKGTICSALTIIEASFGHSNDILRRLNVTEQIQGVVDGEGAGRFLHLRFGEDMTHRFGDPCVGVEKVLAITYRIEHKIGDVVVPEANDRLVTPIDIRAPVVYPPLVVLFATFSPTRTIGRNFFKEASGASALINYYQTSAPSPITSIHCVDEETTNVTPEIIQIVEACINDDVHLEQGLDIVECLNQRRDKSLPGITPCKEEMALRIEYRLHGRLTNVKLIVDKSGRLQQSWRVFTKPIVPSIYIHGAIYGHPMDTSRQVSLQTELNARIHAQGGNALSVSEDESLSELFGDPCYPYHDAKVLQIRYEVKEMKGVLNAKINTDSTLQHSVKIGWPV